MTYTPKDLEDFFDNDLALSLLNISINKGVNAKDIVAKSVYNFDLETPEGITRLIELLPIMDPDIINEVYQEVFPGYPVNTLVPRMARLELKGYFMDFLANPEAAPLPENEDDQEPTEDPDALEAAPLPEAEEEGEPPPPEPGV